ncbi:MAG: ATP-binding protein [Solobacterium sp.]|nr:ATP-binding protein [Solobacterium sp.]
MKEKVLEAKIDNLAAAVDFVSDELEDVNCPPAVQMQIELAVDEIFTNVSMYAYAPGTGKVTIGVDIDDGKTVRIIFVDQGIPYNPLKKDDPDVTLSAAERQIGGLGIYLVKKSMDKMEYRYDDSKNILILTKTIRKD